MDQLGELKGSGIIIMIALRIAHASHFPDLFSYRSEHMKAEKEVDDRYDLLIKTHLVQGD
jgi:hypothetical protein